MLDVYVQHCYCPLMASFCDSLYYSELVLQDEHVLDSLQILLIAMEKYGNIYPIAVSSFSVFMASRGENQYLRFEVFFSFSALLVNPEQPHLFCASQQELELFELHHSNAKEEVTEQTNNE